MIRKRLLVVLGLCCLAATPAAAQQAEAPGLAGGAPATRPEMRLPSLQEWRAPLPRSAKAATALAGLGRQRLALVVGLGTIGNRVVVAPATRDAQAIATALRSGGFVVMRRDDVSGGELRAALSEFRRRLHPEGVGFVYLTALGAQLAGSNLLLPRDTPLALMPAEGAAALSPQQLRAYGVTLADVVAALAGSPDSLRILVVDAAYRHPALAALPQPGLTEQALPPGVLALFGHGLNVARDIPAAAPLPEPAPADPAEIAATPFARVLAGVLTTPGIGGPQALLSARRAMLDLTQGRDNPWLGGETDSDEELAEATLLDALVPRTPEEMAREGMKQAGERLRRQATSGAGERSVADVLAQPTVPKTGPDTEPAAPGSGGTAPPATPELPSASGEGGNASGNVAGEVGGTGGSAVGSVAGTAGTVLAMVGAVAATGAALTAMASAGTASEAATVATVASVAGEAAVTAGAQAGQAALAVARTTGKGGIEAAAREAERPLLAAQPALQAGVPAAVQKPSGAASAMAPGTAGTMAAAAAVAAAPIAAPSLGPASADAGRSPPSRGASAGPENRTVRQAEGGERPAYTPRRNAFGYAEGDTFSYRVFDRRSEQFTGSYTTAIEQVLDDGRLVANGLQMHLDAQGRTRSQRHADGSFSEFLPVQGLWWSQPKAGERREVSFKEIFQRADQEQGETEWQGSSRVGARQRIETPAGEFDVLPIESRGSFRQTLANGQRSMGLWNRTVYYSTQLGHPVAIDIQDVNRSGRPVRHERMELTHAQTSRGAP